MNTFTVYYKDDSYEITLKDEVIRKHDKDDLPHFIVTKLKRKSAILISEDTEAVLYFTPSGRILLNIPSENLVLEIQDSKSLLNYMYKISNHVMLKCFILEPLR